MLAGKLSGRNRSERRADESRLTVETPLERHLALPRVTT